MMISGKTLAFVLIACSACIHASWNVAARSLKGNFSVLIIAIFLGGWMSFPLVLLVGDFRASLASSAMWLKMLPTMVAHGSYLFLLATAYSYGDVGLVYPMSRGTGIILATTITQVLALGVPLTRLELCGVAVVVMGIFMLCFDAYNNLQRQAGGGGSITAGGAEEGGVVISRAGGDGVVYTPIMPDDAEAGDGEDIGTDDSRLQDAQIELVTLGGGGGSSGTSNAAGDVEAVGGKTGTVKHRTGSFDSKPGPGAATLSGPNAASTFTSTSTSPSASGKVFTSIALAACVGCCTATYSIIDSMGVNVVPALHYSFLTNVLVSTCFFPYLYLYRRKEATFALSDPTMRKYLLAMGPTTTGAYLIILFVFEIPGVNVALVVTLREFSVLIATVLGVLVLGERSSAVKIAAVATICVGIAVLKLG